MSGKRGRSGRASRRQVWFALVAMLVLGASLVGPFGSQRAAAQEVPIPAGYAPSFPGFNPPSTVYIAETQQPIDGVFLDFWRKGGGAATFGNPLTPEFLENGRIVQYYNYARFEYWPENIGTGFSSVQLGNIGAELRPMVIQRSASPAVNAKTGTSIQQISALAAQQRAWLPVAAEQTSENFRYVPETGHAVTWGFKAYWEAGGYDLLGNPVTEEYKIGDTTYQVFEKGQLAWTQKQGTWMVPVGEQLVKRYKLSTEPTAQGGLPTYDESLFYPGGFAGGAWYAGERWVDIDLTYQYMLVYEGNTPIAGTYISSGKRDWETPTGDFNVLMKYVEDDMTGNENGESWDVPDVPHVQYFTNEGHALHGAYWHNEFGKVRSHGCVNLPLDIAEWLFDWAPMGMRVHIRY